MKFTSEDLMKAMGLQVGDRIKICIENNDFIFGVILNAKNKPYLLGDKVQDREITILLDYEYEILPRPKRVGDLTCNYHKDCDNCPLRILFCDKQTDDEDTLYDILNRWNNEYVNFDQEIYDLLKSRLDKEVNE